MLIRLFWQKTPTRNANKGSSKYLHTNNLNKIMQAYRNMLCLENPYGVGKQCSGVKYNVVPRARKLLDHSTAGFV